MTKDIRLHDTFNYKGYQINNSKAYKNKISLFKGTKFIGDFGYIIEAKQYINDY